MYAKAVESPRMQLAQHAIVAQTQLVNKFGTGGFKDTLLNVRSIVSEQSSLAADKCWFL